MKKFNILFLALLFFSQLQAQVGIGTTTPNANAVLEVVSTSQGVGFPQLTTAQRDVITSPAAGLVIYNTTTNCLNFYTPSGWNESCGAQSTGLIVGNGTCTNATIFSVSGCASVPGATVNDDTSTAEGIEYDWTGATGYIASNTTTQALVQIAGQCWYRINADKIPDVGEPTWVNSTDVGWNGYYTSGPYTNEGRLYQWSAAMNASTTERAQGICATGFHVPSDCEWMYLENAMGMSTAVQQTTGFRDNPVSGTGTGSHLSTLTEGATNKSGFSALLAGLRSTNGTFFYRTSYGFWWSSSASGASLAFRRYLATGARGVSRTAASRAYGFSVRCLKD
jgi:uncharacterized protein (TIGR02145 family)